MSLSGKNLTPGPLLPQKTRPECSDFQSSPKQAEDNIQNKASLYQIQAFLHSDQAAVLSDRIDKSAKAASLPDQSDEASSLHDKTVEYGGAASLPDQTDQSGEAASFPDQTEESGEVVTLPDQAVKSFPDPTDQSGEAASFPDQTEESAEEASLPDQAIQSGETSLPDLTGQASVQLDQSASPDQNKVLTDQTSLIDKDTEHAHKTFYDFVLNVNPNSSRLENTPLALASKSSIPTITSAVLIHEVHSEAVTSSITADQGATCSPRMGSIELLQVSGDSDLDSSFDSTEG